VIRRLTLLVLVVVVCALAAPQLQPAPAQAQAPFRLVLVADISPPRAEPKGDDHATAEVAYKLNPVKLLTGGDNQYEGGSRDDFFSPVGFDGSYGRLLKPKIIATVGNHDVADPGPGAPSQIAYFQDFYDSLPCRNDPVPCHPERGYFVVDYDANRDGILDWFSVHLDSDCGRYNGSTGDPQTPSCADNGEQANWLRSVFAARHGGQTSGRKCSIMVWHHEYIGTSFFANDDSTRAFWLVGNHFHNDGVGSGHTHGSARMGPMTWDRHLSASGGQRQWTFGAGGRSLTPHRVTPPEGLRERDNTRYGVMTLDLSVSQSAAGWQGGAWTSQFHFTNGTTTPPATAGCWP
jgi:hypothetical protein